MGVFKVSLQVGNPFSQTIETVDAMVDTGAIFSVMPSSMLRGMGIEPVENITFGLANGEDVEYPTGWALFSAEGRRGMARVVFGPEDQYLMGATTLEDLLLMVDPVRNRLIHFERPPLS